MGPCAHLVSAASHGVLRRERVARVHVRIIAASSNAVLLSICMLALLPYPHVLRVVAAAAAMIDWKLSKRAKTCAVLAATRLSLRPCSAVQAAAHALVRAAAYAKRRIIRPTQLRAAEV